MNKKLKVTLNFLDNITCKYPYTSNYIEENLKEVCEGEGLVVEEVICFVVFLCLESSCFKGFEQIDGLLLHPLATLF